MTVCGDRIYLLGGGDKDAIFTQSVYSCSLTALLLSIRSGLVRALFRSNSSDMWTRVANLPVSPSTAVSLYGQLIVVGGRDSNGKATSDIQKYSPSTNSWEVISHMVSLDKIDSRSLSREVVRWYMVGGSIMGGSLIMHILFVECDVLNSLVH